MPGLDFPKHEKLPFQRDYRRLSPNELSTLLSSSGFKNIETDDVKISNWQINIFATAQKL
jgi:hypothetical protein